MSRSLGPHLPPDLRDRLSQAELPRYLERVLPLTTVDQAGRPHPMLLSALEVRAVDSHALRMVIAARSRSARNLLERQAGTMSVIEPEGCYYVKARATEGPLPVSGFPDLGLFLLTVEDVLEDAPAEWESGTRIITPLTYALVPSLDAPRSRATLAALAGAPSH